MLIPDQKYARIKEGWAGNNRPYGPYATEPPHPPKDLQTMYQSVTQSRNQVKVGIGSVFGHFKVLYFQGMSHRIQFFSVQCKYCKVVTTRTDAELYGIKGNQCGCEPSQIVMASLKDKLREAVKPKERKSRNRPVHQGNIYGDFEVTSYHGLVKKVGYIQSTYKVKCRLCGISRVMSDKDLWSQKRNKCPTEHGSIK